MTIIQDNGGSEPHPWITAFVAAPDRSLADFLSGYARIEPYGRAEPVDAARILFKSLSPKHPARTALDNALDRWLKARLELDAASLATLSHRDRHETMDGLAIVAALQLPHASEGLRRTFVQWMAWCNLTPQLDEADVRASFLSSLALTQRLTADRKTIAPFGLEPFWISVCEQAGGRWPETYLDIALLGLRKLPERPDKPNERPWMTGLARWATVRRPSVDAFQRNWLALKRLYPRTPAHWRQAVTETFHQTALRAMPEAIESYWREEVGALLETHGGRRIKRLIEPPPMEDVDKIIARVEEPIGKIKLEANRVISGRERHAQVTGESHFLVRTACNLGQRLLESGSEQERAERGRLAVDYARKAVTWEDSDPYVWALWRDGLIAQGRAEEAELVGWNAVRRFPEDSQTRNQLAGLLSMSPDRESEAESLLRETIHRFPSEPMAKRRLAHLLARGEEGLPEAIKLVKSARALEGGAGEDEQLARLEEGVLESRPKSISEPPRQAADPDDFFEAVLHNGRLRRLAARMDWTAVPAPEQRAAWVAEAVSLLAAAPYSVYARYLHHQLTSGAVEDEPEPVANFGLLFMDALKRGDRNRFDRLEKDRPDSSELVQMAKVLLFQDSSAAAQVVGWLARRPVGEGRSIMALRGFLALRLDDQRHGQDGEIYIENAETLIERSVANDNFRLDLVESVWALQEAA